MAAKNNLALRRPGLKPTESNIFEPHVRMPVSPRFRCRLGPRIDNYAPCDKFSVHFGDDSEGEKIDLQE